MWCCHIRIDLGWPKKTISHQTLVPCCRIPETHSLNRYNWVGVDRSRLCIAGHSEKSHMEGVIGRGGSALSTTMAS